MLIFWGRLCLPRPVVICVSTNWIWWEEWMQKTICWKVVLQPTSVEKCTTVSRLILAVFFFFSSSYSYGIPLSHTTVQLASTSTATFAGFMVQARDSNILFRHGFEEGSTIWGTWIADQNNRYHAIECNRSINSSEGPFQVRYYPQHRLTTYTTWHASLQMHVTVFCAWDSSPYLLVTPTCNWWGLASSPGSFPLSSARKSLGTRLDDAWCWLKHILHTLHSGWLCLTSRPIFKGDVVHCLLIHKSTKSSVYVHSYTECSYTECTLWPQVFRPLLESTTQSWFTRRVPGTATTDSVLVNVTKSC